MKTQLSALLLAALCAAVLPAQEETKVEAKRSTEPSQTVPRSAAKGDPATSEKVLIQQLGDADYQVRKQAEDQLRSRGKDALRALEDAAKNHSDEEVRWRARRLAKQVESGDAGALRKRPEPDSGAGVAPMPLRRMRSAAPFGQGGLDLDESFNQMFERMEREFGIDIPRQRFFQNDFFKDLERQMQDSRHSGGLGSGQSMQMSVDPDGVKVKVEEKSQSGKSETKTYEAPSLEEFRAKYPDVARQYLDGGTLRVDGPQWRVFRGMPDSRVFQVPGIPDQNQIEAMPVPPMVVTPSVPAGERLGVYVEPVGDEVRESLGLDADQGLQVKEVMPGSLGEKLGLASGDVLLQVGGTKIHDTEDVRNALRSVEGGAKVTVKISRKGKEETLAAEKPAVANTEPAPLEPTKELKKKGKKKSEIR